MKIETGVVFLSLLVGFGYGTAGTFAAFYFYRGKIRRYRDEKIKLKNELRKLHKIYRSLENTISILYRKKETLERELYELENRINKKRIRNSSIKEVVEEVEREDKIKELERAIMFLQEDRKALLKEIENLRAMIRTPSPSPSTSPPSMKPLGEKQGKEIIFSTKKSQRETVTGTF
jgi:prefoldin subunit 5